MKDIHETKLKTAETTTLNFLIGKTGFNYALGKLRNTLKYITKDELIVIYSKIENNSMYAPNLLKEEKIAKLKPLKEVLGLN